MILWYQFKSGASEYNNYDHEYYPTEDLAYEVDYEDLNESLIEYFAEDYCMKKEIAKILIDDLDLWSDIREKYIDDDGFKEYMHDKFEEKAEQLFYRKEGIYVD